MVVVEEDGGHQAIGVEGVSVMITIIISNSPGGDIIEEQGMTVIVGKAEVCMYVGMTGELKGYERLDSHSLYPLIC